MNPLTLLYWLIVGHFVMDFWAQSDALAQMKNRNRPNTRIPPGQKPQIMWPYALTAHAAMHGMAVAVSAYGHMICGFWPGGIRVFGRLRFFI